MPPHQYVLTRRVERAQQLQRNSDLSLVDIAASAGSRIKASKFSTHFKRVLRRHAATIPAVRKNRAKLRESRQDPRRCAAYDSPMSRLDDDRHGC